MVTNIQRIYLYALAIVVILVVFGIWFNISDRAKLSDVRLLSDVRKLSYSLERYKQEFSRYPIGERVDLRTDIVLSENGFSRGTRVFYSGRMRSHRAVTYQSDEKTYTIIFTLRQRWPDQGLEGTKCTVTQFYRLTCT